MCRDARFVYCVGHFVLQFFSFAQYVVSMVIIHRESYFLLGGQKKVSKEKATFRQIAPRA
jgi:hypothetical protein